MRRKVLYTGIGYIWLFAYMVTNIPLTLPLALLFFSMSLLTKK